MTYNLSLGYNIIMNKVSDAARLLGKIKSSKKAEASRANGIKGGRPPILEVHIDTEHGRVTLRSTSMDAIKSVCDKFAGGNNL